MNRVVLLLLLFINGLGFAYADSVPSGKLKIVELYQDWTTAVDTIAIIHNGSFSLISSNIKAKS